MVPEEGTAEASKGEQVPLTDRAPRAALGVFVLVVVAAVPLYVIGGRDQWFFQDEWDFLAERDGGSLQDLLRPHNEHWSTLPIIVYRILWRVVGLRSYLVYQSLAIGAHLAVGVLLRLVTRRAGVGPWIATVTASAFVLFGSGYGNILWGFQIGFIGALALGLCHLLFADHDGPISRRDWLGLVSGLAALMCSGPGVTMVVVVGMATLLRRGWRAMAFHVIPLGAVYLAWWIAFARDAYNQEISSPSAVVRFVATGLIYAFGRLGQAKGMGLLLATVLVAGLVMMIGQGQAAFRRRAAGPAAMCIGAVIFLVVTGIGRASALGPEFARKSRYAHVLVALLLPALAIAVEAFIHRWRALAVPAVAVLLIGVPGNIGSIDTMQSPVATPELILAMAHVPAAAVTPRELTPLNPRSRMVPAVREFGGAYRWVTVGWLRDGVASGRIPDLDPVPPREAVEATLVLALYVEDDARVLENCRPLSRKVVRRLEGGDSVGFRGVILVAVRTPGGVRSRVFALSRDRPSRLVTRYGPLIAEVGGYSGAPAELCD